MKILKIRLYFEILTKRGPHIQILLNRLHAVYRSAGSQSRVKIPESFTLKNPAGTSGLEPTKSSPGKEKV